MRFVSQCMTLSAAGLLALGAASGASAQQQQPRDSSIESGAVTGADTASTPTVSSPSMTTDTGSTVNSGNTSQPSSDTGSTSVGSPSTTNNPPSVSSPSSVSSDTGMTGMVNDTSKSRTSTDTALKAKPGVQTGPAAGDTGGVSATTDTSTTADTSKAAHKQHHKKGAKGYKYTGAPSDTTLHAKPGTQTGKSTDSASARPDSTH
ncbi:MAG TPA: hypothetical protein VFB89_15135 [Gemmatimonadales bacterium]|nr:hypothetical protein [Gemmatimonadales bacterium]